MDGGTLPPTSSGTLSASPMNIRTRPVGIEWNESAVIKSLSGPPNSWNEATIQHNVLNKYLVNQIQGTAFDPDSIMLYFFLGDWVKSGVVTHQRSTFCQGQGLRRQRAGLPQVCADRSRCGGTQGQSDAAYSGVDRQAGGRGSVRVRGQYRQQPCDRYQGPTDVVMRLYGPNSQTDVITEDDDSGKGSKRTHCSPLHTGSLLRAGTALQPRWRQRRLYDSRPAELTGQPRPLAIYTTLGLDAA